MGNRVVAIPSQSMPLAATDLYQVFDTSDLPGGVVNILTGAQGELSPWLASHMDVNAIDVTGADGDLADLRLRSPGLLFQQSHLIPTLTALENVQAKLAPAGFSSDDSKQRAEEMLAEVGLA